MVIIKIKQELRRTASPEQAKTSQGFFKTGPGEYAEGDVFIGVKVPRIRQVAKIFRDLELDMVENLLQSKIHEERLLALLILVQKVEKGDDLTLREICEVYLGNTQQINNWDLVDLSADKILGPYFFSQPRDPLYQLAESSSLWERRIAILTTFYFIKRQQYDDTLAIAKILLEDKEDLIHKAVGWMLREVGKQDQPIEEAFLQDHATVMPRTMLRYAIERFPEPLRQNYLRQGERGEQRGRLT